MEARAKPGLRASARVVDMQPGIQRRTLTWGDRMLASEIALKKGGVVPLHQHVHEQIEYVISGRLEYTVDGERHEVGPGDALLIQGDALHGATALEDTVILAVFSPVREEYK